MLNLGAIIVKQAALRPEVKLQRHQEELRERARNSSGQIANWRVGAGKTPGAIAVAEDRGGDTLVIGPAALRNNFNDSVKRFTTEDRHNRYHVISYEQFSKNPEMALASIRPKTVILDELQRARNPGKAQNALMRTRHQMPFVLGLTGSLVNNHPKEIAPLVNIVSGKQIYRDENDFVRRHVKLVPQRRRTVGEFLTRKEAPKIESVTDPQGVRKVIGPYVHRYMGDEKFNANFPTVQEQEVRVPMQKQQWALYQNVLKKNPNFARKIKNNLPPSKNDLANMNAFSVAVRQISNTPANYDLSVKDPVAASPKMQKMIEEQHRLAKNDPHFRSVVYSSFLDAGVTPVTKKLNEQGLGSKTFRGGMTDKQRAAVVKDFNEGRTKVLGISPAGGEGLDLKGVRLLQMTEDHWNPERGVQVQGRGERFKSHAHLPPEKRNLLVQKYLATAPKRFWHPIIKPETTIDEWIVNRRKEKNRLNQEAVSAL